MVSVIDQNLQPTTAIHGNLRRTRNGAIWAGFRIRPIPYGYTSDERKYDALTHHKNLIRALPNDSVIAGQIAAMDPDDILSRVVAGTDLDAHPQWRAECEGKLDYYQSQVRATERILTLDFPVVDPDNPDVPDRPTGGKGVRRSTDRDRSDMMAAAEMAAAIVARLPSVFELVPLTSAQMIWRWNRAITRGSAAPDVFPSAVLSNVSSRAGAFRQATFDEGERNDNIQRWKPSSFAPLLKITQPGHMGAAESWQTLLAVESLPLEGLQFPGSEFFTIADQVDGCDVDWAVRINKTAREQAIGRNTKNLRRVSEQISERDTEVSFAQNTLADQVALLAEYNSHLESNDDELEVALCPIFVVAGPTRPDCERSALEVTRAFERNRLKVVAPLGGQRELWSAMNPGGSRHRAVSDFSHVTISEFAAASVPCGTTAVGDAQGPIIAENLTSKNRRHQPVHLDLMNEARKDSSPSFAVAGELGAGKSFTIKSILSPMVDQGAQFMAVDRTDAGEYAKFAESLPNSVVVDMVRPKKWSFDPLRIFPADIGIEKTLDLLLPMFGCSSDDPIALTLAELLRPELQLSSLPALKEYLECADLDKLGDGATDLRRSLSHWAGRSYSAALFDKNLEPLPLDADAIVVRTNRLEVPSTEEVSSGTMSTTKKFGQAMYGLSAAIARQAFFSNLNRFGTFVLDEAYHVTSTQEGLAIASMFIRDGRRHNSGLILGSHDPTTDYPAGTALNLIPIRMVFRHRDELLAKRSLEWLGIDTEKNPHIVRDLRFHTSPKGPDGRVEPGREGEGYMRDARGAIGRIKVLGPSNPVRVQAINTTPQAA